MPAPLAPLQTEPELGPPPGAAYAAPPFAPARSSISGQRLVFIVAGILLFCFGLYKLLNGLGVLDGGRPSGSSSSSYAASDTLSEHWFIGAWAPLSNRRYCEHWIRFSADHTFADDGGSRGTWQLSTYGGATGTLTLMLNGTAPRTAQITRLPMGRVTLPGVGTVGRSVCGP